MRPPGSSSCGSGSSVASDHRRLQRTVLTAAWSIDHPPRPSLPFLATSAGEWTKRAIVADVRPMSQPPKIVRYVPAFSRLVR